jgi:hypothetical protein
LLFKFNLYRYVEAVAWWASHAVGVEAVAHRLKYGDDYFAVKRFVEATLARLEEERLLQSAYDDATADFAEWSAAAADRFTPDELPNSLPVWLNKLDSVYMSVGWSQKPCIHTTA